MNRGATTSTRGFRGLIARWFAGAGDHGEPRREPVFWPRVIDSPCRAGRRAPTRDPGLIDLPADEHARRLLDWIHDAYPNGGLIPAAEVMAMHADMCLEHQIRIPNWTPIARAVRARLGTRKEYIGHTRICAYRFPARRPALVASGAVESCNADAMRRAA